MRKFDYTDKVASLFTSEIVALMGNIREMKGKQDLFIEASPDILTSLLEVATIQSTVSSNRIEGIFTSGKRINELFKKAAEPCNRTEEDIAGYRDVLATIHESYDHIPLNSNIILQIHRDLYSYSGVNFAGKFKDSDNIIAEIHHDGRQSVRFKALPAFQTPEAVANLCEQFNEAMQLGAYDPLLLVPMFILDFLCIHPFLDGNGRVSRLLTLLLLYKSGYIVGKYISIERLIEETKESYYDALQASSFGWLEGENSYLEFTRYMLGILQKAYSVFGERVEHLKYRHMSKADRVRVIIERSLAPISKREIMDVAPDISLVTVERDLKDLQDKDQIAKVGQGRSTKYVKK